jgi:prepilin signal peptidase PulO-like enzyme (type II secretory pathway)
MSAEPTTLVAPIDEPSMARPSLPWLEIWAGVVAFSAVLATINLMVRGQHATGLFVPILCLVVVGLAAAFDAATGRLPNPLTYTAILLGLFINSTGTLLQTTAPAAAEHWLGAVGPKQAFEGLLLFGGIGVVSFLVRGMGGGDMKQIAAVGAMLGISRAADALLCALAIAIVNGLVNLVVAGRLSAALRRAAGQLLDLVFLGQLPTPARIRHSEIPVAIPIFLGVLLAHLPVVARISAWLFGAG